MLVSVLSFIRSLLGGLPFGYFVMISSSAISLKPSGASKEIAPSFMEKVFACVVSVRASVISVDVKIFFLTIPCFLGLRLQLFFT